MDGSLGTKSFVTFFVSKGRIRLARKQMEETDTNRPEGCLATIKGAELEAMHKTFHRFLYGHTYPRCVIKYLNKCSLSWVQMFRTGFPMIVSDRMFLCKERKLLSAERLRWGG